MSTRTDEPISPGTNVIEIDGVRQVYHVHGTGPVCLAQAGGPGVGWEYLRMPAVEEHLTLVYVEPIGTGESGRLIDPSDYRVAVYSRFVHGLVEHLGQADVWLLGHSHGGFVAQQYALEHAERLAGMILYSTSPVADDEFGADAEANVEAFVRKHPNRPEAVAMRQTIALADEAHDDESATEGLRSYMPLYFFDYWGREQEWGPLRAGVRVWYGPKYQEEPPFDVRSQLASIQVPTLFITGVADFICGPRWARMLEEGIVGSRSVLLPASGHFGHLEEPEAFAREIADFTSSAAIEHSQGFAE